MTASQPTVLIDGFNLALEKGTGVATYGRNLSYVCRELGHRVDVLYGKPIRQANSPLLTDVQFADPQTKDGFLASIKRSTQLLASQTFGIGSFRVPMSGDVISRGQETQSPYPDAVWNATDLYRTAEESFWLTGAFTKVRHAGPVGLVHWTYPLPVRIPGAANIYTIHDLVPLRLPYTTLDNKSYYLRLMQKIVKSADHIVTVSETSRNDIIRLLGCPEEKVTNTYQSVNIPRVLLEKTEEEVAAEVQGALGLPYKGYILFFGAIEPKKNVGRLIEAYLTSGVELPLVLIGSLAWKSDQEMRLYEAARRSILSNGSTGAAAERIRHFDYAPFSLLISAIRGAHATIFPSLYEGFGLPILESMLLGTPVVTSREGATAEIAGDAAILVDPYNVREIAESLRFVASTDSVREKYRHLGMARAEHFSHEQQMRRLQLVHNKKFTDYPIR